MLKFIANAYCFSEYAEENKKFTLIFDAQLQITKDNLPGNNGTISNNFHAYTRAFF